MSLLNLKKPPILTASHDIDTIIQPLKEFFGVTSFNYQRNYSDGSEICLTNQPAWTLYYFEKQLFKKSVFAHPPHYYHKDRILWTSLAHHQPILTAAREFNIDHGITFVEPQPDKNLELFFIATARDNPYITGNYFRYLHLLENFLKYFRQQAAPLLQEAEKNRIVISNKYARVENPHKQAAPDCKAFLNLIKDKITVRFSLRERDCIKWLLRGYTPKMIASELGLSYRTVETHINHIKQKTNSHTKCELLRYLINNPCTLFTKHS